MVGRGFPGQEGGFVAGILGQKREGFLGHKRGFLA